MDANDSTPSFDLPAPSESVAGRAMRGRISSRLFGDEQPPQQIAHYEVLRRVGTGGMGVVYAARDTRLDRTVALKLLRSRSMSEPNRQRLIAEARTLARLSHPNVVQVYEVGEFEEHGGEFDCDVYVAMEFVDGQTLARWQRSKRPALGELLRVFRAAGQGLAAAHEAGIIHRDFKPTNVLVGADGRVRVVDFGLASSLADGRITEAATSRNGGGSETSPTVAGTPGYIAPELFAGRPADERSDQFAFCVSLWELVKGFRPHDGDPHTSAARAKSEPLRPLWLKRALLRGLSEDPADRWPTIASLVAELDRARHIQRRIGTLLLGCGVVGGLAVSPWLRSDPTPCPDPSPSFDQVWSEQRMADLRVVFARSGLRWQPQLEARLGAELGRQRAAWIETRDRVCQATYVDKTRSEQAFDRANACLDRHLERIESLVELLSNSDANTLAELERQLDTLGEPQACAEPVHPLPPAKYKAAVDELERDLDRLELAFVAGRRPEAALEIEAIVRAASEMPFAPLQMESLHLQARIARELHDYGLASSAGFAANLAAERSSDDGRLFRIRRYLVSVHLDLGEDLQQARHWLAEAEATFDRLGRPPDLRPALLHARAELAVETADLLLAEQLLREAIELSVRQPDADARHLQLALANVLAEQGRSEDARVIYTDYRDAQVRSHGSEHPNVGVAELDLCALELELGDTARARPHCERAFAIQAASFGERSLRAAAPKSALAELALLEGNFELALELAESIWAQQSVELPRAHDEYGNGLRLLANAQILAGEFEAALASTEQLAALAVARDDTDRASLEQNRGWLRCRIGRCAGARPYFEAVLELVEDPTLRAYALLGLANVELELARVDSAVVYLDAADELSVNAKFTQDFFAERAWLHAWATFEAGDHQRARAMVADAVDRYGDIDPRPDIRARLTEPSKTVGSP